jgi:hypothetical protein
MEIHMRGYRKVFLVALLGLGVMALAHAGDTLRVDSQVLTVGDTAVHALDLLGKPLFKEPVENEFGAHVGERWQYKRDEHVVIITIIDGKVADIDDRTS